MRRWLRVLVCLMVICSLLINLLPTRAKAVGISASAVSVAASLLLGLGIGIGVDAIQHSELANNAVTALQAAGVVVSNGLMDIVSLGSGLFGVKSDVIQILFNWLHTDSGIFSEPSMNISSSLRTSIFDTLRGDAARSDWGRAYALFGYSTTEKRIKYMATANCPFVLEADGKYRARDSSGNVFTPLNYSVYAAYVGGFDMNSNYARVTGDNLVVYSGSELGFDYVVNGDVTVNFVANPGISLAEGYPEWHANSVVITDNDNAIGERYYPIALGNSLEETQSMTQEQVWAGEGTYVDTETGTGSGSVTVPETVTLSDILAGVLSIPNAIATGIEKVVAAVVALPAAIVDGLRNPKPPDDHNNFALADLKNFFPFCIPFDLYAFFQLLNADPVAPVLSWEIQDLAGQTYSLSVDLAEWDSVAQLFRRLQLFLFITGLAAASRKFIKW